ncbi:jg3377 [Pararge aegeria aegeria]|uniref:Coronin n=1 Tax=Pararge aegeria aegeria TaxID=348720 RepID=A0A8S4RQE0_9NEOP|nr:jg3377 [Pararge aegeria aegeria]
MTCDSGERKHNKESCMPQFSITPYKARLKSTSPHLASVLDWGLFPSCSERPKVWFRGVRSSKFRHVYGVPFKRERCYDNIKITRNAHDSNFCAVNPKFVAIVTEVAGGGAFLVLPLDHTGRLDFNASRVTGHKGPVLDIKWNPFNDNIIASCSDDCTVKLWHIPDGGLSMHLTDWLVELHGHKRRVAYIEWHPTAENILLSAGFDYLIFVWDVGKGEAIKVIDCHSDVIYCMSFNRDGSLIATTSKDKKLRVIEPRRGIVLSEGQCHTGTKASKCTFLGSQGKVLTTGFSRYSDRQYAVWDQHDLSKPLLCETIDSSSGVVFPYYDYDTNMVYLAGKGDGNIRYYEVVDEPPYVHFLNQFLSGNPQVQVTEKCQKTSANQNTKFHQLQRMFGKQTGETEPVPLYKQINQGDVFNTEHELRLAFNRQGEELRIVKRQLQLSQQRVRELEQHIASLQTRLQ